MQGEKQQDLGFVNKWFFFFFFGKAHKSKRICEVLFDVAKCKKKRKKNQIEKERERERVVHEEENREERTKCCNFLDK